MASGSLDAHEAVVRALFDAHRDGRIDDAVELVHRDLLWQPWFRPALSVYSGRDGFRQMLTDAETAKGPFRFEVVSVEAGPSADRITVRSRAALVDQTVPVVWDIQFRDGLICDVSASIDDAPDP